MLFNLKYYIIILTFILSFHSTVFTQQFNNSALSHDSLSVINDSLKIHPQKKQSYDVDTTVYASSKDSLIFSVQDKKMKIFGEGSLNYKQTEIKSANIIIDFDKSLIEATGTPSDTAKDKLIGTPVLKEGNEVYDGRSMQYNYKNGSGLISSAQTQQDGSKYTGSKIKKVDKETFFIKNGIFTTCDAECPHYYFTAYKMKVIDKKELIADWIFLNFGGVPFPVPLPFAVFPIESGRRSGIIPPTFGSDATYGTYFSGFGYFWAINDYMDINLTADYYTRGSYKLDSRFRYAERYNYSGNFQGSYGKFITGEPTDANRAEEIDWRILWNHNQTITPTLRFDAKLEFLSGSNIQRNISDFNQILRTEAVSNATIFKQWEESGNSLSLSYSRNQNFETNDISEVLPNLTFSLAQSYPLRVSSSDQKWYETFGYNYSGQLQNNRNKVAGNLTTRGGIQHNLRFSLSPKIGYISISPNLSYNSSWYNKQVTKYTAKDDSGYYYVKTDDVNKLSDVRTFSLGVSASTKFFGMFNINSLGINAIRHTVTPSISYNYAPDFSTPFWGYYANYLDSLGKPIKYNKYEREIFSRPSNQEQQSINFSVGNLFEMKTTADPTDTTSKENKIQLLNLNASMGYNFAADSLKFSDLNISYRTQIANYFSFSGATTFTPYSYNANSTKINKFLIDDGKGLLRMTNFNFSFAFTFSGYKIVQKKSTQHNLANVQPQDQNVLNSEQSIYQGLYSDKDPDFTIPWNLALNYYYNEYKPTPNNITKSSNISGSFNFNLTPAWKFSVTGSYDLVRKEFAAPQVRISRDLHCWIMNFTWNPIGTYRGYSLEIRVKAPQLQDLKLTKRDQFFEGR
jgi:lipopolysaccharide assembly outer membrane protein LptD (OstA)